MKLKVVKHKNYGCTISSMPRESLYESNFFWSFYELNNESIIVLDFVENLTNGKATSYDYSFSYTKSELKCGKIINYKFGNAKANNDKEMAKEFFDWFESCPGVKDLKKIEAPSLKEKKCVKEFFMKNIMKTKEVPTNTIEI